MKRTTQFFFTLTGQYNALILTPSKASKGCAESSPSTRPSIKTLLGRVRVLIHTRQSIKVLSF